MVLAGNGIAVFAIDALAAQSLHALVHHVRRRHSSTAVLVFGPQAGTDVSGMYRIHPWHELAATLETCRCS